LLDFPDSPNLNDIYQASGNQWIWNGSVWKRIPDPGSQGLQGLQGNQGNQGRQGLQGLSNQGAQNAQGTQGRQGLQGLSNQGAQNAQGTQGSSGGGGGGGSTTFVGLTDTPANFTGSANKFLAVNSTPDAVEFVDAPSGLESRGTLSGTTGTLTSGSSANLTITGYKTYALLKVEIDNPAWVTIYTDTSSRTADASRTSDTDPIPGSGVIAEVYTETAGSSTFLMSPGVLGWNNDGTPSTNIYLKVENTGAGSAAITVDLTAVKLEA